MADTFSSDFDCEDCGRNWNSLSAMMSCPCDRFTVYGYPKESAPC